MNHEILIAYLGIIITLAVGLWNIARKIESFITRKECYDVFITKRECELLRRIEEDEYDA